MKRRMGKSCPAAIPIFLLLFLFFFCGVWGEVAQNKLSVNWRGLRQSTFCFWDQHNAIHGPALCIRKSRVFLIPRTSELYYLTVCQFRARASITELYCVGAAHSLNARVDWTLMGEFTLWYDNRFAVPRYGARNGMSIQLNFAPHWTYFSDALICFQGWWSGQNLPNWLPVLRIFPDLLTYRFTYGICFERPYCVEFLTWGSGEASGLDCRKSLSFGGNVCIRIEHASYYSFECIPHVSCT